MSDSAFQRDIERVARRTRQQHQRQAERIPDDVLLAEVERRGYSAVKVTTTEAERPERAVHASLRPMTGAAIGRDREARAEAEALFRAEHPTTSSDVPKPQPPLTLEQRVERLEYSLGAAISRIAMLEGRSW